MARDSIKVALDSSGKLAEALVMWDFYTRCPEWEAWWLPRWCDGCSCADKGIDAYTTRAVLLGNGRYPPFSTILRDDINTISSMVLSLCSQTINFSRKRGEGYMPMKKKCITLWCWQQLYQPPWAFAWTCFQRKATVIIVADSIIQQQLKPLTKGFSWSSKSTPPGNLYHLQCLQAFHNQL